MSEDNSVRYRFTVPAADSVVNDWIDKQSNIGFSLRTIIRAFVATYGYQDATCLQIGTSSPSTVKKRGRPPKTQTSASVSTSAFDMTAILPDNMTAEASLPDMPDMTHDEVSETIEEPAAPGIVSKKTFGNNISDTSDTADADMSSLDILNMIEAPAQKPAKIRKSETKNPIPAVKQQKSEQTDAADIDTDDDGFVDPASLF